ncbi:MAG: VacJ family lipoprotein [Gammaproteobacteria bacterium]|nr:VacJ family lipoprotein [Gammaproteobacteria bacterium]
MAFVRRLLILVLFVVGFSGCATVPTGAQEATPESESETAVNDPLEGFNRTMYSFNNKFDRYLLKPVASGYRTVTPAPVRKGVSNFFSNLREPLVLLNNVLQGKFKNAASDLGRFVTNTTIGVFGLFDVASHVGLERHTEDFGQTLGAWGVGEGPYLVLPFLGPSNVRDGFGLVGDYAAYPPTYMEEQSTASKLLAVRIIDTRTQLLDAGDILEQAAGEDSYVFVREAYLQRRRNLVSDGAQGLAPVDPSLFEDDSPAPTQPSQP